MSASSPRVVLLMRMARGRNGCKHSLKLTHQQPQPTPDPGGIPTHARVAVLVTNLIHYQVIMDGMAAFRVLCNAKSTLRRGSCYAGEVKNGPSSPERIFMKILTRNHFILRIFARTYTTVQRPKQSMQRSAYISVGMLVK